MDLHAALCAGRPHPPLACAALPAPRGYPGSAVTRCLRVWAYSLSDRNRTCDAGPYSLHAAQVDYTAYVRAAQPYFCQAVQEQRWYAPVLAALTVFGAWKFISLTIARLFYRLLCWCRRRLQARQARGWGSPAHVCRSCVQGHPRPWPAAGCRLPGRAAPARSQAHG